VEHQPVSVLAFPLAGHSYNGVNEVWYFGKVRTWEKVRPARFAPALTHPSKTTHVQTLSRQARLGATPTRKPPFGLTDLELAHPKIVADFMPDRVGDHLLKLFHSPRHLFMRSLINRDLVRQNKAIAYAPHGSRAAMVEAQ